MRGRSPRPFCFTSFSQAGGPELPPILVALRELSLENELQPALTTDRNEVLMKGMVSNPDLRPASVAPKTDWVVTAKLAELFGQTIPRIFFCWHALLSVLE